MIPDAPAAPGRDQQRARHQQEVGRQIPGVDRAHRAESQDEKRQVDKETKRVTGGPRPRPTSTSSLPASSSSSSFQHPIDRQPGHQHPERHGDEMRMEIGEQEGPERKLVDGLRDDPAGCPIVEAGRRQSGQPIDAELFDELAERVEIAHQQRQHHRQQAGYHRPADAIRRSPVVLSAVLRRPPPASVCPTLKMPTAVSANRPGTARL